jgi:hypothetical protein
MTEKTNKKNHVVLYIISTIFYCKIHISLCLGYEIQKNIKLFIIFTTSIINILNHLFIYLFTYHLFTYAQPPAILEDRCFLSGLKTPSQIKKHCQEVWGSKNWTDLPKTLERTKGLESWLLDCVIAISIRCPEDAIITTRLI